MKNMVTVIVIVLGYALVVMADEGGYVLKTDYNSKTDEIGVLGDETSRFDCNNIIPNIMHRCYYPQGDYRNEIDNWLNNDTDPNNECVLQTSGGYACPDEDPYKRVADWTECPHWDVNDKSKYLLDFLVCNYDNMNIRSDLDVTLPQDAYIKFQNFSTVDVEAKRMADAAAEIYEYTLKGNRNMITLFGIKHFAYWPHKELVDREEILNSINTLMSKTQVSSMENITLIMELMATEASLEVERGVSKN